MTDKMTITEALKHARRELEAYRLKVVDRPFYQREVEYLELVVEALEKQIPKKPNTKFYEQGGVISKCPVCGDWDGDWWFNEPKYCRGCGQAIDWDDEDCEECIHFDDDTDKCLSCGLDGNYWFVKKESDTE